MNQTSSVRQIKIAPSILSANFANFAADLTRLNQTNCDYIHLDVMDGHFVKNLTFGAPMIQALRPHTSKVFDVHLMMSQPEHYLDAFIEAGSDIISIHKEIPGDVKAALKYIRQAGKKASLALNPDTGLEDLEEFFPLIDQLLLMSVYPGFANQKLIPEVLTKGKMAHQQIQTSGYPIDLEIDGGVNGKNISEIAKAGFNVIVAGGYVFKAANLNDPIETLEQAFL